MQSVMNLKIKYRESFRPFAPSVLASASADYFEHGRRQPLHAAWSPRCSRSCAFRVTAEQQKLFGIDKLKRASARTSPAITHVDYSARIQTVHEETNPRYYALLKAFEAQDRLRRAREHLVQRARRADRRHARPTPTAASCAPRWTTWSLENFVLEKTQQTSRWKKDDSWQKEFELD